jgi:hypothetical protein
MVSLELLQRRKSSIPLFREREPLSPLGRQCIELVRERLGLAQERERDEHDAEDGQRRPQDECGAHRPRTGTPASS